MQTFVCMHNAKTAMPINMHGVFDIFRNIFKLGNAGMRLGARLTEQLWEMRDGGLPKQCFLLLFNSKWEQCPWLSSQLLDMRASKIIISVKQGKSK